MSYKKYNFELLYSPCYKDANCKDKSKADVQGLSVIFPNSSAFKGQNDNRDQKKDYIKKSQDLWI